MSHTFDGASGGPPEGQEDMPGDRVEGARLIWHLMRPLTQPLRARKGRR
jgi:hypothetical protein